MRTLESTLAAMGELSLTDKDCIHQGFDAGNYAAAYETEDYDVAQAAINGTNGLYRAGHLVGFFGSYELHEIPEQWRDDVEHYRAVIEALDLGIAI
jgi:hypothetical protein